MKTIVFGTAWFSNFKIEAGAIEQSNTWNILCVMFENMDVNIDNQNIKLRLTSVDKEDIKECMRRFKSSMEEMSEGKIKIDYDLEIIPEPITNISYDKEQGYYVSGYDVRETLDKYIELGKYDHIFVAFRTGNINQKGSIPINDWVGLGYMEYRNLGFSNIRLPDDDSSYVYKYNSRINQFPEEVLVHEFLHTLERNADEYGEERPALHDNEEYGYQNKKLIGLKEWYTDYINKNIKTSYGLIGLPTDIFTKKPAKATNFNYVHEISAFKEPQNIIEEFHGIINKIRNLFIIVQKNEEAL